MTAPRVVLDSFALLAFFRGDTGEEDESLRMTEVSCAW